MSGESRVTDDVRALVAASIDGVGVVDDEVFVHANRALAETHGVDDADELVGWDWQRLYPAAERERLEREALPRVRAEGRWCGTTTGRRVDGRSFTQRLSVARTPGGRLLWVVREESADATPGVGARAVGSPPRTDRATQATSAFEHGPLEELTDRQREVLGAAYRAGYFDWPRERTAEEVADSLGIAAPTLHAHIRKAESSLLAALFDGPTGGRR